MDEAADGEESMSEEPKIELLWSADGKSWTAGLVHGFARHQTLHKAFFKGWQFVAVQGPGPTDFRKWRIPPEAVEMEWAGGAPAFIFSQEAR
jgi:hypothetical protein